MIVDDTYNYGLIDLTGLYTPTLFSIPVRGAISVHDGRDIDPLLLFFVQFCFFDIN